MADKYTQEEKEIIDDHFQSRMLSYAFTRDSNIE